MRTYEYISMRVAVSSTGEKLTDNISEVFARCPYFIIAEIKDQKIDKTEIIENKSTDQMSEAGISAAQLMAEKNVNAVITGNVGPRAFDVLKQFNIEIYTGSGIIKEVLQKFINGKLKKIEINMITLTDENFEKEVIKNEKPILVDFWSPTCPPCVMLGPIIKEIAKEFEGRIKVGKLNVMENQETAEKYEIFSIPTIIIFKEGEIKERAVGLRPKQVIIDKLNSIL